MFQEKSKGEEFWVKSQLNVLNLKMHKNILGVVIYLKETKDVEKPSTKTQIWSQPNELSEREFERQRKAEQNISITLVEGKCRANSRYMILTWVN